MQRRRRGLKAKAAVRKKDAAATKPDEKPDPFIVIGKQPRNMAYQWVAETILGEGPVLGYKMALRAGWRPVPARRHPKMPSDGKHIVVGGQVLMERNAELVEAELQKIRDLSKAAAKRHDRTGVPEGVSFRPVIRGGGEYPTKERIQAAIDDMPKVNQRPYVEVSVTIGICLTDSEIATGLCICPDLVEYGRRRLLMAGDVLRRVGPAADRNGEVPVYEFIELKGERLS